MRLEKTKICIFTKLYPYGMGEAFLDEEVKVLSKNFSEIVIFPFFKSDLIRLVPGNVQVDDSFASVTTNRFWYLLRTVFSCNVILSLFHHFKMINSIEWIIAVLRYENQRKIFKAVLSNKGDVFKNVICYSYWFDSQTYALIRWRQSSGINFPIISRAHRFDIYEDMRAFPYRNLCIQEICKIFCIAKDGADYLSDRYCTDGKILVSRLGVKNPHNTSLRSSGNAATFISVSQVSSRKRILRVCESIQTFANNNSNYACHWHHFGAGPLMEDVRKLSKRSPDNLTVTFWGQVPNTEILAFYSENACDLFINLSESEGVPVSIMEAQAFGIPVIATNVGGTGEIVSDAVGALLVPDPDISDVVTSIERVLSRHIVSSEIISQFAQISDSEVNYMNFVKHIKDIIEQNAAIPIQN